MKTIPFQNKWLNTTALLLLFPSLYFLVINLLKFELGIHGPYDASYPTLNWLGIEEGFGWNINLLIVFNPVIVVAIAAWQVLRIDWMNSSEQLQFNIAIRKKPFPLFIIFLGGLILGGLGIYLIGENVILRG